MVHSLIFSAPEGKPFVGATKEYDSSALSVQLVQFSHALDNVRDGQQALDARERHWSNDGVAFDPKVELGTDKYAVFYVPSVTALAHALRDRCSSARAIVCYYVALTETKAVITSYAPVSRSMRFLHLAAATSAERIAWNQFNDVTPESEAIRVMQQRVLASHTWASAREIVLAEPSGDGELAAYLCHTDLNYSPEDSKAHDEASSVLSATLRYIAAVVASAAGLSESATEKLPALRYDSTHVAIREAGPADSLVAAPMRVRLRAVPDVERVVQATLEAAAAGATEGKHPNFFYNNALVVNPGKKGKSYLSLITSVRTTRDGAAASGSSVSIPVRAPVKMADTPQAAAAKLGFVINLNDGNEGDDDECDDKKKSKAKKPRSKSPSSSSRKRSGDAAAELPPLPSDKAQEKPKTPRRKRAAPVSVPPEEVEDDVEVEEALVPPPLKRARATAGSRAPPPPPPPPPPATAGVGKGGVARGKAGLARAALQQRKLDEEAAAAVAATLLASSDSDVSSDSESD